MTLLDLDTPLLKEENHPRVVNKEIKKERPTNLPIIIVVNWVIQLMSAGVTLSIKILCRITKETTTTATKNDIIHMNVGPRPCTLKYLKDIVLIVKNMGIDHMSANPIPNGHQKSKKR